MSQTGKSIETPQRVPVKGQDEHPVESSLKLNGPPGTGKTTQLLERVTRLLDADVELSDITFVTYRTEMAEEFLRRLRDRGYVTDEQIEEPWAHETRNFGTLHAVCNRITIDAQTVENKHRRHFLWDEYKVQYDGRRADLDTETDYSAKVGSLLFDAYSWCIENKQFSFPRYPGYKEIMDEWPQCPSFQEFDKAWSDYKEDGGSDGQQLQDFEDMLRRVDVEALAAPGDILIVDEYHDFTPIMASIIDGWMENKDTVIVGADPLQAIYSYKGASPEFYHNLDLPELLLDRTYRVPSNVWQYARGVIDHTPPDIEPDRVGGKVSAARGSPKDVVEKYGDGSVMFLARTKSQVRDISNRLKEAGVVFRSQKRAGGWNHSTKRLPLYNALQKIRDVRPVDSVNPQTGQTGINRYSDEEVEKGVRIPSAVELTPDEMKTLVRFTPADYFSSTKKSLKTLPQSQATVTGEDLRGHVEPSFWSDMTNGAQSVENLLSYDAKDTIRRALVRNDEPFGSIATADIPDVMTIHASKGKEADTVVLYDGIPPAVQKDIRRDEVKQRAESRVWYVGATRAAENLLVIRDEYDYCQPILPSIR